VRGLGVLRVVWGFVVLWSFFLVFQIQRGMCLLNCGHMDLIKLSGVFQCS